MRNRSGPVATIGGNGSFPVMRTFPALAIFAIATTLSGAATAQVLGTYRIRAGVGPQVRPDYLGSDKHEVTIYPELSIARENNPFGFSAPDDSFDIKLIGSGGFSAGPAANLRSGRSNSDVGLPLGEVDRTFEFGIFAEQELSESFRVRGELLKGIGGHEGLVGSLGADTIWRDGDKYLFSIGPRLRIADAEFHRAYFGVTPLAAAATGLAPYNPNGGIYAVGITSGANYDLGKNWGLFGYGRYDRLIGDARKSPVVRDLGSANQFSAGIGLSHTFSFKL